MWWNMKKDNKNKGFSLFTVIIAVSFIAILGLLVIYISVSNFYMKVTDLKTKDGFYTAERGLEEIKVGLQQDVGDAMSKAFTEVMENYDKEDSTNQSQSSERQSRFQKSFIDKLKDLLKDKESSAGGALYYNIDYLTNEDHLNKSHVLTDESKESLLLVSDGNRYIEDMKTVQNGKEEITGIILKNLKIIYVDAKGRASIIKTDICLGTPQVRFPTSSTLPDLMNMVVVANGGIICEAGSDVTLKGNIYAGLIKDQDIIGQINTSYGALREYGNKTSIWVQRGAKLSVESNNMLVTQAEINVDHSGFSTGPKVQLWTRGITVGSSLSDSANVALQGTSYLADDITVASGSTASDANITLAGTYYGYGSVESEKKLKEELDERVQKADKTNEKTLYETVKDGCIEQYERDDHSDKYSTADLSSAIMINGKNTTLDLSKIEKMILSGKSYISTSKNAENNDVLTGESITVKGSQLAYLAPTEILGNESEDSDSLTNPLEYTEENKAKWSSILSEDGSIPVKWNVAVETWGGKTLNDLNAQGIELNKSQPVQRVIYRDPGGNPYAYFYLNFAADNDSSDSTNASKYMQFYYENNGDMKTKMDDYFAFYFKNNNSGIFVNDEEAYARYITNGNILSFETDANSEKKQGKLYDGAEENTISGLVDTSVTNRLKWYSLNRKMIDNYGNLSVKKTDSDPETKPHNEAAYSQSVFDNIVNETKMVEYLQKNYADKGLKCQYPEEGAGDGPQVIMLHNENGAPLEITADMVDTLRLVVCTGDVVIDNVTFTGIIMTKGKITLKAGATLQTAPIEAANVFQAQMGANTELKPEDFFWDGNNYVRGNTNTDDDTTDELDLADYVYYKNWKKQ